MNRTESENLLIILSAWAVYGFCQYDAFLPILLGLFIGISYFIQARSLSSRGELKRNISWVNLLGISLLMGWIWRGFVPESPYAMHNTIQAVIVMQSALVFLSLLIWFRKDYYYRSYALRFLAWGIVALSINVQFDQLTSGIFWVFCLINTCIFLARPFEHGRQNTAKKGVRKSSFAPGYFALILVTAFAFSTLLIIAVQAGDRAYMNFIRDYLIPFRHHFLSFNPTLSLEGPGYSGRDIRPIIEITPVDPKHRYFTTQVFEEYNNGVWKEIEDIPRTPLPKPSDEKLKSLGMVLFFHLRGVMPSPAGVESAASGRHTFEQDTNGIVYSVDPGNLKAVFYLDNDHAPLPLSPRDWEKLTRLSPYLRENLKTRNDRIMVEEADPLRAALKIHSFFQNNFFYSLDVNYKADDAGLLAMLDEKRPAYCSFFASAMALMLRERNIPSRVKVGFLATETIDNKTKYLVRVRDAHAWVEAYLPTGNTQEPYRWMRFDPTPSNARWEVINTGRRINPYTDYAWRMMGRLKSEISSLNTTDIIITILIVVFLFMVIKNYKEIMQGLKDLPRLKFGSQPLHTPEVDSYREVYLLFEEFVQKALRIRREDAETTEQFIARLEKKSTSKSMLDKISSFLIRYHAVRFGEKNDPGLKNHIVEMLKSI